MAENKNESSKTLPRWLVALAVVVFIPLAADFNARMVTIQQMRQEESRLVQALASASTRRADLEATRMYIQSDAYVEHWARVEARMAQPGQVAVIPVLLATPTPQAPPTPPASPVSSPLEEWWALFFTGDQVILPHPQGGLKNAP